MGRMTITLGSKTKIKGQLISHVDSNIDCATFYLPLTSSILVKSKNIFD